MLQLAFIDLDPGILYACRMSYNWNWDRTFGTDKSNYGILFE